MVTKKAGGVQNKKGLQTPKAKEIEKKKLEAKKKQIIPVEEEDDDDDDDLEFDEESDFDEGESDEDDDDLDEEDEESEDDSPVQKQTPKAGKAVKSAGGAVFTIDKTPGKQQTPGKTPNKQNKSLVTPKKIPVEESDDEDDDDEEEEEEEDDDDEDDDDDEEEEDEEDDNEVVPIKGKTLSKPAQQTPGKLKSDVAEKLQGQKGTPKAGKTPQKQLNKSQTAQEKGDSDEEDDGPFKASAKQQKAQQGKQKRKNEATDSSPPKKPKVEGEADLTMIKFFKERDARSLFMGNLPKDVTIEELKALSPDIVDVRIPSHAKKRPRSFSFVEFSSEAKADDNYKRLQNVKVRGSSIILDYVGAKSKKFENMDPKLPKLDYTRNKLFVRGLPQDTQMEDLAKVFPKAVSIDLIKQKSASVFRNAVISYENEEAASKVLQKSSFIIMKGQRCMLTYALKRKSKKRSSKYEKRNKNKLQRGNQKSVKQQPSVNEEGDDDDDDEDSD